MYTETTNIFSNYIIDIIFFIIIIILCVFIYFLHSKNNKLNRKLKVKIDKNINLSCPDIKCPKAPICPDCPDCPEPVCKDPECPSAEDIMNTIFPGRGVDLAGGNFVYLDQFKNIEDINNGSDILNNAVNTVDSKYLINKQDIEMEKIKAKLRSYADDLNDDSVSMYVPETTPDPETTPNPDMYVMCNPNKPKERCPSESEDIEGILCHELYKKHPKLCSKKDGKLMCSCPLIDN